MRACSALWTSSILCMLALGISVDPSEVRAGERLAFEHADGYGKFSQGGRGGRIIYVTSLNDNGPGTLRECVEAQGPRNCLFKVAGIVELTRPIMIGEDSSFVSILGQTAPGGGVLLTISNKDRKNKHTPFIIKRSHNVILRHIRIRPRFPNSVENVDALTIEDSSNIYVDHISGSWATDENINTHADSTKVTIAHSIFGEGLNKHSKCALLGSDPRQPQEITFWGNACVSNRDRNPDNNHYGGSCIDVINNVFFNARSEWGEVFSQYPGGTPISYVGNYFKAGPSTEVITYAINWNDTNSAAEPRIYQHDNLTWSSGSKKVALVAPDTERLLVSTPPCPLSVGNILTATDAYRNVRQRAGAFPRDAIDARLIKEIADMNQTGQGRMVKAPGELPPIAPGEAYADADGDGIADSIELAVGAKPGTSDPWEDGDGDGWSNFDQFMEKLAEHRIIGEYP